MKSKILFSTILLLFIFFCIASVSARPCPDANCDTTACSADCCAKTCYTSTYDCYKLDFKCNKWGCPYGYACASDLDCNSGDRCVTNKCWGEVYLGTTSCKSFTDCLTVCSAFPGTATCNRAQSCSLCCPNEMEGTDVITYNPCPTISSLCNAKQQKAKYWCYDTEPCLNTTGGTSCSTNGFGSPDCNSIDCKNNPNTWNYRCDLDKKCYEYYRNGYSICVASQTEANNYCTGQGHAGALSEIYKYCWTCCAPECSSAADCNDHDPCTTDSCINPGLPNAKCSWSRTCSGSDTSCGCSSCTNCNNNDGCYSGNYRNYYCSGTSCTYSLSCTESCCDAYYGNTDAYCSGGVCNAPSATTTTTTTTTTTITYSWTYVQDCGSGCCPTDPCSGSSCICCGATTTTTTPTGIKGIAITVVQPYVKYGIVPVIQDDINCDNPEGCPNFTKTMPIEFLVTAVIESGEQCNSNNCNAYYYIDSGSWNPMSWDEFSKAWREAPSSSSLNCDFYHDLKIKVNNTDGTVSNETIKSFFINCKEKITVNPMEKRLSLGESNIALFNVTVWNPKDSLYNYNITMGVQEGTIEGVLELVNFESDGNNIMLTVPAVSSNSSMVYLINAGRTGIYQIVFSAENKGTGNIIKTTGTLAISSESLYEFSLLYLIVLMLISAVIYSTNKKEVNFFDSKKNTTAKP